MAAALRRRQVLRVPSFRQRRGRIGPDLTIASGRFSTRDLLESIVDPSKEISDQYAVVVITTIRRASR